MSSHSASDRHEPAPPELPPRRWLTGLFCVLTLGWVFAFTPTPWALATIPGIIGWLAVVERSRSLKEAFLWLIAFGAIATIAGYSWLAQTIQDFGGIAPAWSWVLTGVFGMWNIVHGLIFVVLYRAMLMRGRRPHPLLTAALLAACETLPIRMFAWSAGHGAVDVPPLLQHAEWGGVPAVSFVLLCLVIPVYEWARAAFVRGGAPARTKAAALTFLVGAALFVFGMVRYDQIRTEETDATKSLRVAIVQANIGASLKRTATHERGKARVDSIAAYRRGTERAAREGADLIVWPESAITDAIPMREPMQTNQYLRGKQYDFLNEVGRDHALLIGLYEQVRGRTDLVTEKPLPGRYNVAALRQPGDMNAPWTLYRKVYLIPFGEKMPLGLPDDYLPQNFTMLAGESGQPLLETRGLKLAPFLCYEGILPDHVREYVGEERPDVLMSLTNDSWFGDTWEPHQHLNFTRFRAVEHRVPMVRSTNTGISAFVSATGDVESRLGVHKEGVLVREVPLVERERTIYVRYGYRFPVLLWIVALAGLVLAFLRPPPLHS